MYHVFRIVALLTTCGAVYLVFRLAQSHFTYMLIPLVVVGAAALQFLWIDIAAESLARAKARKGEKPKSIREKLWSEFGLRSGRRVWSDPAGQKSAEGIFKAWQARKLALRQRIFIILMLGVILFALMGLTFLVGYLI
jgi:hypothetical protein